MKTSLFFFLLFLNLCVWSQESDHIARVLTYASSLEVTNNTMPDYAKDYLKQKYGDSLEVVYDTTGNIRMNYFLSGDSGLSHTFYNAVKHFIYARWRNLDTLYYYDASVNEYILDSMIRVKTEDGFVIQSHAHHPDVNGSAVQEFYFVNDSLPIDPNLYKDFHDFFFYEIISEAKMLPVKTVIKSNDMIITRQLKYNRRIPNPKKSIFFDNGSLPLKEY